MFAVQWKSLEIVQYLVEHGANTIDEQIPQLYLLIILISYWK